MRILMLSQFYPPIIGGEAQHVRTLSTELASLGHEVAVVTLRHQGQAAFILDQGVRVYSIRSSAQRLPWLFSDSGRQFAPPSPDLEIMLALRRIIEHEQPEIVHAHNWLVRSFLPLKVWSRARLIVTLHNYNMVCAKMTLQYHEAHCDGPSITKCLDCSTHFYGLVKGISTVLANRVMSSVERNAVDMFLPISQAAAIGNGLVDNQLPFRVIPNFMPSALSIPQGDAQPYLAQLPDQDYLLFVGALGRLKGVDVLLRAYADLTDAPPLVLIGFQTPEWPMLIKDCPRNVLVLKDWPRYAILEAWRRSIIALVPSVWAEPCPAVVQEAMLVGRPVVASRIGGIADLVADGETGLLVQPDDSSALREAIKQLLANPDLRNRMGEAALRKVSEFQASVLVPYIEQVYRQVLQPKAKRSREIRSHSDRVSANRR